MCHRTEVSRWSLNVAALAFAGYRSPDVAKCDCEQYGGLRIVVIDLIKKGDYKMWARGFLLTQEERTVGHKGMTCWSGRNPNTSGHRTRAM